MIFHYKRAVQDIRNNRFLNVVTIVTVALSILIVSAFYLFFVNASEIMNAWKRGVRIMAYLEPGVGKAMAEDQAQRVGRWQGVQSVQFISKTVAFQELKEQMKRQSSLLEDLKENPLPDALEIRMAVSGNSFGKIETLAARLEALEAVSDVEYGEKWLGRFSNIFDLFKFVGYALGGIFSMAAVFIIANTIRLVLYSRQDEVEIMRLVGATDHFIKAPFFIQGLIQGALGGILGLTVLFVAFLLVSSNVAQGFSAGGFEIRFVSAGALGFILLLSMLVGWLGSYLSLRTFFKA